MPPTFEKKQANKLLHRSLQNCWFNCWSILLYYYVMMKRPNKYLKPQNYPRNTDLSCEQMFWIWAYNLLKFSRLNQNYNIFGVRITVYWFCENYNFEKWKNFKNENFNLKSESVIFWKVLVKLLPYFCWINSSVWGWWVGWTTNLCLVRFVTTHI